MTNSPLTPGIVPGRLPAAAYARNFGDHEPALDRHEALEAHRTRCLAEKDLGHAALREALQDLIPADDRWRWCWWPG